MTKRVKDYIGFHCLLTIDRNTAEYFDSFRIEYIPQDILDKIKDKDKSINQNILKYNRMILSYVDFAVSFS